MAKFFEKEIKKLKCNILALKPLVDNIINRYFK